MKPLVSIVSPCYNGEEYIGRFLESVLNQTYPHLELILINDGSTDGTENIIAEYEPKIKKKGIEFKYIYQENSGQAKAVSQGLKIFKGEYLIWPDSDDILYPDNIEKKVGFLEANPECGGVVVKGRNVTENDLNHGIGVLQVSHKFKSENIFERLLFENFVYFAPAGYMVRRECVLSTIPGGDIYSSACGQNWQILLPISYTYKFGFLDDVLFDYVIRETSHSHFKMGFSKSIDSTYVQEDCLRNTLERIRISDEEKEKLLFRLKIKYIRRRYRISRTFDKKDSALEYFKQLKELNQLTFRDRLNLLRCFI